ncbi:hypothetical protein SERLA73DRAFT_185255 [Serpula lacrymans var. lacrymans S7.3]|uniref:SWI5-dependent HO expression protein 3 n=2 Tax=Serpula lacrymans var. lacrymans TaxID=341189 RepID=F8Q4D7_SERL3|nr:uncharacterized protein SERLADRAFT_473602 [Serpula lacrymans var. lacrymans S7.9]EGN96992.1 hypothetical protein SERLA73DRAFT_185255 [Serpula lacrymans var. lacrymans S7.3]EGO22583.1 hypothetical protein SERLADRAFT_473602 [Serpula lacrymans var. lacrymans S7.9]
MPNSISLGSPFLSSRPLSRPSSRTSVQSARAISPSVPIDDSVAVRNQVSSLKHSIRQKQAQLHTLENVILRGPRPLPPGFMSSPPHSPVEVLDISSPPSYCSSRPPSYDSSPKVKRRSSFDVLHGLAGPESSLPLPRRDGNGIASMKQDGIREGIPMDFGPSSSTPTAYKRISSPTRTLSRIPKASVGNARALADEGSTPRRRSPSVPPIDANAANSSSSTLSPSTPSLQPPASPNRRISLTPGGTTRVLADLQTGVSNAKHALENTKGQLRVSQRTVAQLTRQTEDLKESRERLRLENEGLNNVVARKERLLQELLERARKAEAEAATLKSQLKSETATSKKSLREMETALAESSALSQKCEREYITLRDSLKSMTESWKTDTGRLREEMRKREEKSRKEMESVGKKYKLLLEEVKAAETDRETIKSLRSEDDTVRKQIEDSFRQEIGQLKQQVESFSQKSEKSNRTADHLSGELARLRRLMQTADQSAPPPSVDGT